MFKREEEMYPLIKSWLEDKGHTVRSEVCKCDIVSEKDGIYTVFEMKLKFNLDVIYQALERMTSSNYVYIIVPIPDGKITRQNWDKRYSSMEKLCRKIGIGLIVIYSNNVVSCLIEADDVWHPKKSEKKNKRLISEFSRRSGDYNIGGIHKQKLMTAYKEDSLRCIKAMKETGRTKPSDIKQVSNVEKAGSILLSNVYGWFIKKGKGYYVISEKGLDALKTYEYIFKE